jgi:hypothetical protein
VKEIVVYKYFTWKTPEMDGPAKYRPSLATPHLESSEYEKGASHIMGLSYLMPCPKIYET